MEYAVEGPNGPVTLVLTAETPTPEIQAIMGCFAVAWNPREPLCEGCDLHTLCMHREATETINPALEALPQEARILFLQGQGDTQTAVDVAAELQTTDDVAEYLVEVRGKRAGYPSISATGTLVSSPYPTKLLAPTPELAKPTTKPAKTPAKAAPKKASESTPEEDREAAVASGALVKKPNPKSPGKKPKAMAPEPFPSQDAIDDIEGAKAPQAKEESVKTKKASKVKGKQSKKAAAKRPAAEEKKPKKTAPPAKEPKKFAPVPGPIAALGTVIKTDQKGVHYEAKMMKAGWAWREGTKAAFTGAFSSLAAAQKDIEKLPLQSMSAKRFWKLP